MIDLLVVELESIWISPVHGKHRRCFLTVTWRIMISWGGITFCLSGAAIYCLSRNTGRYNYVQLTLFTAYNIVAFWCSVSLMLLIDLFRVCLFIYLFLCVRERESEKWNPNFLDRDAAALSSVKRFNQLKDLGNIIKIPVFFLLAWFIFWRDFFIVFEIFEKVHSFV